MTGLGVENADGRVHHPPLHGVGQGEVEGLHGRQPLGELRHHGEPPGGVQGMGPDHYRRKSS